MCQFLKPLVRRSAYAAPSDRRFHRSDYDRVLRRFVSDRPVDRITACLRGNGPRLSRPCYDVFFPPQNEDPRRRFQRQANSKRVSLRYFSCSQAGLENTRRFTPRWQDRQGSENRLQHASYPGVNYDVTRSAMLAVSTGLLQQLAFAGRDLPVPPVEGQRSKPRSMKDWRPATVSCRNPILRCKHPDGQYDFALLYYDHV
jgi:hypothetical protein